MMSPQPQLDLFEEPRALGSVAPQQYVPISVIVERVLRKRGISLPHSPHNHNSAHAPVAPRVRCRYCFCTEDDPCRLADGDKCFLRKDERGYVCSNVGCIKADLAVQRSLIKRGRAR